MTPRFSGVSRYVDVGLRLAPTLDAAVPTIRAAAALLDEHPNIPVRLAGVSRDGTRLVITLVVTLGTVEDVKSAAPNACAAVHLLRDVTRAVPTADPAFVVLPDPRSPEALLADAIATRGDWASLVARAVALT